LFSLSALPRVTFLGPESHETLMLSGCEAQIRRASESAASLAPLGGTVGLVFSSSPDLVLAWLGVLFAGRVPLILQYPNDKINKHYWKDSLRNTITRCHVGALLCAPALSAYDPDSLAPCLFFHEIDESRTASTELRFPEEGHILQLSSGTTGFKKPIRFSLDVLRTHTTLYNQALGLTAQDCIVSWLPLYHDMGFIACFVMPLMLGIPIVMIDPMTWVRQPRILFDAIEKFAGTVCYMPNFGFEVMARLGKSGPFPSMRRWISCSEPTYPATLKRFIESTHADPAVVSTCYGMAENIFAVTLSSGLKMVERDGKQCVSCGCPIPQTEVKEVDGELCVRSPHSLQRYEEGDDIRDEAGFYPSGDLGFIENGEIIVTGRKQDLANVGGRKYLLTDWDFSLGQLFPPLAGRIASLSVFDPASGTEKPLFLIEAPNFWEWENSPAPACLIREKLGVEWMEVHFVPPHFITKTSSGKINRKRTLADWQACRTGVTLAACKDMDAAGEFARSFPGLSPHIAAHEQLDSLGQLLLKIFCEERGIEFCPDLTPARILQHRKTAAPGPQSEVFSILALIDGNRIGFGKPKPLIDDDFLEPIARAIGCPVHFEHLCVPPVPILFSDLVFLDYFLPRNPDPAYGAVASILQKIKNASLILIDDEDCLRLPEFSAYPVLDHRFTIHPDAELLGHRLQRYTQDHHLLPRRVVLGRDITPDLINSTLKNLQQYLAIPVFKMAFHAPFQAFTNDWDFCAHTQIGRDIDRTQDTKWLSHFREGLLQFIRRHDREFPKRPGDGRNRFTMVDTPHFCSILMNRMAVDFVTRIYNSFCIVGLPSSVPYLQKRLDQLAKPYFFSSRIVPAREDYECLILTGGVGGRMPETGKPTFDFMHAREEGHGGGRPHNVPPEIFHACPPLAACDEQLFRALLAKYGVTIGNFLLNHTKIPATPTLVS
jgi:acyl-CoA synthetase (AMP-forming)/AMP-acid ligase II